MRHTASFRTARRVPALPAVALLALALLLGVAEPPATAGTAGERPLPEFANRSAEAWLNSAPLSRADLVGKVVLIEAWSTS